MICSKWLAPILVSLTVLLGLPNLSRATLPTVEVLHDFLHFGGYPGEDLIEGSDGYLYGTVGGGSYLQGLVFKVRKDGSGYTVLKSFGPCVTFIGVGGCNPRGGLIEGSDGNLYGTTNSGGASGYGTVFRLGKDGSGFVLLKSFDCSATDGCYPRAGLIEASDGNLYGTTSLGGVSDQGTVFKLGKDGSGFMLLKSFGCSATDGCYPYAGLIEGGDGNLYGTTGGTGALNQGTVFKLGKDGSGYTLLKSFSCVAPEGCVPYARMIEGSDGNLYGTTSGTGALIQGTVFKLGKDGSGYTLLKSFGCVATVGCLLSAGVIEGSDGNLYGTTRLGGSSSYGAVFKLAKDGTGYTELKSYDSCSALTHGCSPVSGLIEGSDRNLYGTTLFGGTSNEGTLFKLSKDGSGYTLVMSYGCSATEGCYPLADMIEGSDGNLYGTTSVGGAFDQGTVFKLGKDGSSYTLLNSFNGCGVLAAGCETDAQLNEGRDGNLYGTTNGGGALYQGTVFKLGKDGSGHTVLKSFGCSAAEGCYPNGVIVGSDGNLYGTTYSGGASGYGTVFRLGKDGSGHTLLRSFACFPTDGCNPSAGLIEGSDGNLYGTTYYGGASGGGTVFRLGKDGSGYTLLRSFACYPTDGCYPSAGLIEGSDGNLYGTTYYGGASGGGTVFKLGKDGSGYTLLRSFLCSATEGCTLSAAVIEGSDGNLYGTTVNGGSSNLDSVYNQGTVFKLGKCPVFYH